MRLDDCYRLLDLKPGASLEDARRAHRDLTKVWHPDRFGHDAPLRLKAEEKLKAINEAWETIRDAGERGGGPRREGHSEWRVRARGQEMRARDLEDLARLIARGKLGRDAEIFDPASAVWVPIESVPRLRQAVALARAQRFRGWAMAIAGLAFFFLFRRPTGGGLLVALVLFGVAAVLFFRSRQRD